MRSTLSSITLHFLHLGLETAMNDGHEKSPKIYILQLGALGIPKPNPFSAITRRCRKEQHPE